MDYKCNMQPGHHALPPRMHLTHAYVRLLQDMQAVARLIEEVPLVLPDRYTFCIAPVDTSNSELMSFLGWFARQYAERR